MTFQTLPQAGLSRLVVHEPHPSVGYARRTIVVQSSDTVPVKMGTLVFRVKSVSLNAPYAPVTANSALVATNEFAVVFGDNYSYKESWIAAAAATVPNSVAFVQGEVILKDELLVATTGFAFGTTDYLKMKQLLENQGIVIEQTL